MAVMLTKAELKARKKSFSFGFSAKDCRMRKMKYCTSNGGPWMNRPNTYTVDDFYFVSTDKLQRIIDITPNKGNILDTLRGRQFTPAVVQLLIGMEG